MKFKIKLFKSKTGRSAWGDAINFIFLLVFGLVIAFPMIFAISNSLKGLDEIFVFPPRLFPRNPNFDNFLGLPSLFTDGFIPLSRYLINTFTITIVGTVGAIFVASGAAYVLEKKQFPFRKGIFKLIITTLMFTPAVMSIPSYLIMSWLNLTDTYWAILLPVFGSTVNVFLMKQFMVGVPNTIIEAARIDGAGEQKIFWSIVMPAVKPAWMTLIIFSFQGLWAATGGNYIYSEELKTLPYALSQVVGAGIMRQGYSAAITVLMMLVPITVFIITQSNVLETMVSSGIKE